MSDVDEVMAGRAPARVKREEIAMSDFHGLVRMLELIARRLDTAEGSIRSLLDDLHDKRRFIMMK